MTPHLEAINDSLLADCERGAEINISNLLTLLGDNKNTAIGRKYGFADIKSYEDYKRAVPVTGYEEHREYIERMRNGENDQLTVYPVIAYCRTSGSTGLPKFIPVTDQVFRHYPLHISRYKSTLAAGNSMRFSINSYRCDPDGAVGNEKVFSEVLYKYYHDMGKLDLSHMIGGMELFFVPEICDIMYAKAYSALCADDMAILEGVYINEVIDFFRYIEDHWQELIRDISERRIPEDRDLPVRVRERLLSSPASKERIRTLERECQKGFEGIAKRLWPGLRLVCSAAVRSSVTEQKLLRGYIGDIPRYNMIYAATETVMGMATGVNTFDNVLIPTCGFFEFMPAGEEGGDTLLPHELEVGREYEIIVTTYSGFYRYRIGDVLKVAGYIGEAPLLEFCYRKDLALNLAGEKLTLPQLENAFSALRDEGIEVENYLLGQTVGSMPRRYFAALTLGRETGADVSKRLDTALCRLNYDYEDLRELRIIDRPLVTVLDRHSFDRLSAAVRTGNTIHNKSNHIITTRYTQKEWKELCRNAREE